MKLRIKYTTPLIPLLKIGWEIKYKFFIIIFIILLIACNKDKDVTICGNVRNDCTGNGYPGIEVVFITAKKKLVTLSSYNSETISTVSTITDNNGNFSFSGIEINNNSRYSYGLVFKNTGFEEMIEKDKIKSFHQIGLHYVFFNLCYLYSLQILT